MGAAFAALAIVSQAVPIGAPGAHVLRARREIIGTVMNTSIVTPSRVVAGAVIDTWTAHDWCDGVLVDRLMVHDRLIVRTRHNPYEFIVMSPHAAEALVRGGAFFQEFTRVRVAGCSLGGSFLKVHGIYLGFRIELVTSGSRMIMTSPVETIAIARGDGSPVRVM